ncbi:GGDEF domain-containing protein [Psychromarinibacter sp. C21-152]|uniref:GGDEF domain-containing protein n=1 Tax=Psychromarinibacter sediminicola TaxID=3033385 RepID=A0AAE3NUW8_9RHOB|nr:GGDEF domain-containing protein [Psychromarinibacter sediminicola]MDF0602736.1 GGDEF domain-containing protein [Psychromarinibacter sediminicola]
MTGGPSGPDGRAPEGRAPDRRAAAVPAAGGVALDRAALDVLMPMALIVAPTGHVAHAGPTLAKLRPGRALVGARFLELFELRRPRHVSDIAALAVQAGAPMHLAFRDAPRTGFKGHAVPLRGGAGLLVNLSFGIGAVEALGVYDLTGADFAPTDLTVSVLYLAEASAAVQEESRRLTHRLLGAKSAAEEQANTDTLTGLRNRRAMDLVLERCAAGREPFALMHLDLDFFKDVNDRLGHAAGDHVLRAVAAILREETREADTVARAGGDEFVLIFGRLTDRDRLAGIAARLLRRLAQPILFGGTPCRISGSIGIAMSQDYAQPAPERMLHDADMALYSAKNGGRGRHVFARDLAAGPAAE